MSDFCVCAFVGTCRGALGSRQLTVRTYVETCRLEYLKHRGFAPNQNSKGKVMSMKYDDKLREQIKDLTLMLLYLNSFDEGGSQRSWKGYDFDDLNELAEEGFISEGRRAKSVMLYDEGIEKAKSLCAGYGIQLLE